MHLFRLRINNYSANYLKKINYEKAKNYNGIRDANVYSNPYNECAKSTVYNTR